MFRILIADDEGIMRESIKNTIEANFGSETEIVTVKTGREVVEQAESFRPDIAFVDIQMPGLSGIQAIKEIKKFNSSIVFVVITAYDNFSYAKESVNLGVMEYILKPVNKQKIIDVCIRAKKKTEELRQKRSDDLRIKEKLEIVIPMLETAFINNMLQESGGDRNRNYLNILDIDDENGYVIVFEYGDDFKDGNFTNAVGSNVKMNNYYKLFKETLAGFFQCVTGL
ncbi:MAG: putative response regulatory protein [Firmicutes bacterium ADurb.Bin354]|nr:MAG: putative response regulatory protein [Firmicutes bacterium ADurb.Bin354]